MKKLLKGDGSWATRKIILGWLVDTARQTLELPAHRKQALGKIFSKLARTKRVSRKVWQSYLGKLRFMSKAIPGSGSLFGTLQLALNRTGPESRINITKT